MVAPRNIYNHAKTGKVYIYTTLTNISTLQGTQEWSPQETFTTTPSLAEYHTHHTTHTLHRRGPGVVASETVRNTHHANLHARHIPTRYVFILVARVTSWLNRFLRKAKTVPLFKFWVRTTDSETHFADRVTSVTPFRSYHAQLSDRTTQSS